MSRSVAKRDPSVWGHGGLGAGACSEVVPGLNEEVDGEGKEGCGDEPQRQVLALLAAAAKLPYDDPRRERLNA